jgi:hypothetical protein
LNSSNRRTGGTREEEVNLVGPLSSDEIDALLHSAIDAGQMILLHADLLMNTPDGHAPTSDFGLIERLVGEQADGLHKVRRELRKKIPNSPVREGL